jgi:hypothetical protein
VKTIREGERKGERGLERERERERERAREREIEGDRGRGRERETGLKDFFVAFADRK